MHIFRVTLLAVVILSGNHALAKKCSDLHIGAIKPKVVQTLKKVGVPFSKVAGFTGKAPLALMGVLPFAAYASNGDPGMALVSAMTLGGAIVAIDKVTDRFVDICAKILPPALYIASVSLATNAGELLAGVASATASNDLITVVPNAGLGSNGWNLGLGAGALLMSHAAIKLKYRADQTGKSFANILATEVWPRTRKYFLAAGGFAGSALAWGTVVVPQADQGNYLPMGLWMAANSVVALTYLKVEMFNKNGAVQGRMLDALGLDKEDLDLESVTQTLNRMASNDPNGPARSLLKLAQTLQAYKGEVSRPDGRSLSALSKEFIALVETKQKEFEASPDFLNLARQSLDEAGAEEIKVLLDVAGIKGVSKEQISRSQLVGAIAKIAACAAAFAILGKTLDVGANIMAESLPFLGKGMVAALVVSALTSIPEFVVSKKLIEDNKDDRGAIQNVAYSNLYNLMIAKFSVSLRLGRNALFGG